MNILRRWARATKETAQEGAAKATVSRRIEVTVERETVTMLVRGQPAGNLDVPATEDLPVREIDGLEAGWLPAQLIEPTERGERQ
jgi:hypothetical protein